MPTVSLSDFYDSDDQEAVAAAEPEKRPIASWIESQEDSQNVAANTSLKFGSMSQPEQVADDLDLANKYQLPFDVVSRNRDEYKARSAFDDGVQAIEPTTGLKQWIAQDQNNAAVAQDDLEPLSMVEQAASSFIDLNVHAFNAVTGQIKRKAEFAVGGLVGDFAGRAVSGAGKTLDILGRQADKEVPYFAGFSEVNQLAGQAFKAIGGAVESVGEEVKEFAAENITPEGQPSKADQVASGLGQISGQLVSTAMAPWLAAPAMFAQGVDASAEKIAGDEVSQLVAQSTQDLEMITGGVITGATEFLTSKLFLKVPQSTIIKNKLLDFTAKAALGFSTEALQETSEDVLRDLTHMALTNEDATIDFNGALASGEIGGYVGMITQSVLNGAFHIRARNTQKTFEQLNEASKAQKLRERSPDSYQGFADSVAEHLANTSEGKLTDVYIDADVFNQAMDDAGIQRDFINETFPEIIEQLQEADQVGGGDISLPLNRWIGKLAGTEVGDLLTPHLRSNPEALSLPELEQMQAAQGTIEEQAAKAIDDSIDTADFNKSANAVQAEIFNQVKGAQKFPDSVSRNYAAFVRDFFVARAREQGTTPEAIYEQYSYNVQNAALPETQILNQAQKSGYEGDNVIEADEYVQAVNKGLDMSQEVRMARARDMGFDTDTVYYHGTRSLDIESFEVGRDANYDTDRGSNALFFTTDPDLATTYAGHGGAVYPVYLKKGETLNIDAGGQSHYDVNTTDLAVDNRGKVDTIDIENVDDVGGEVVVQAGDYDSEFYAESYLDSKLQTDEIKEAVRSSNVTIAYDPSRVRSVNAAFDPDYKESANLLAQGEQIEDGFSEWAGTDELIDSDEINDFDFSGEGPFVMKSFHATTNDFDEFDGTVKGNIEGQFGRLNYFTSSEYDAEQNYLSEGPDLTGRIESLKEKLESNFEDDFLSSKDYEGITEYVNDNYDIDLQVLDVPKVDNEPDGVIDIYDLAQTVSNKVLHGGEERILELFIKTEKPFILEEGKIIELFNYDEIHSEANKEIADDNEITEAQLEERIEEFEDDIDEARWRLQEEKTEELTDAIMVVAERFGVNGPDVLAGFYDVISDSGGEIESLVFEQSIRENEEIFYAEDQETGGLASSEIVADIIQELGYDSIILKNAEERFSTMNMEAGTAHIHVFNENNTNIKSVENKGAFDSNNPNIYEQQTRGGFDPSRLTTILNENTDYSTFLHESAHFFLEVYADMATQPGNDQVSGDMDTLLNWFEIDSIGTWNAMTLDERRAAHEQFAFNFEIYLFEGKAPSIEMQTVFDRFAAWLRNVYKSIRDDLNRIYKAENGVDLPILTGEVRDVMDRMLASEEQIEQAEQVRKAVPIFQDQESSGMSDPEWLAYQTLRQEATDSAVMDLSQKTAKQVKWLEGARSKMMKQMQKKTANIRKGVEAIVRDEVLSEPTFAMMRYFKYGESLDENGDIIQTEENTKLNVDGIREIYDGEFKSLKYGKSGMLSKYGMHPDIAADLFNFESGVQLIEALLESPSISEEIRARTDERMLQEHGELSDPKALESAVDEALHNKARAKFVSLELRHLAKATQPVRVMLKAARQAAKNILEGKIIKDIYPKKYIAAEGRAARKVLTFMRTGKSEEAVEAKQTELLNNQLAAEAIEIQAEVTKIVNKFKRIQKPGAKKNMRGEAREQLEHLLSRFDLRVSPPKPKLAEERQPLSSWMVSESDRVSAILPMIDDGNGQLTPDMPSFILDESVRKHYKDMTISEIRDLNDAVTQFEVLARREQKMYLEVRQQNFEQERDGVLDELREINPKAFNKDGTVRAYRKDDKTALQENIVNLKSRFDAQFINLETMLDVATAGKGKKIFESLFGRLSDAADRKNEYLIQLGKELKKGNSGYSKAERYAMTRTKMKATTSGRYLTREERITVGLYYGSNEGRQRLADGNGYSEIDMIEIINTLDEKDVKLMQTFWKISDEIIWPDLEAMNKRTAGIAPPKIEAAPFKTRFGEVKGGYVPLSYDGDLDTKSMDIQRDAAVSEMLGGTRQQASTPSGSSKERLAIVNKPLMLSMTAIDTKLNETIHDITHREAIADTYRLLTDKGIGHTFRNITGPDAYKAMTNRVRDVAVKPRAPQVGASKWLQIARKNTLINLMGANVSTVVVNAWGILPAINRVGPMRFAKAMAKMPYDIGAVGYNSKHAEWILEKSPYMKNRLTSFDRDLNEEHTRTVGKDGFLPSMSFWFAGLSAMDRAITMPTWMAAYEKGMDVNKNDDKAAVLYADRVIRQSQSASRAVDLSAISANENFKIFTMFYSFFSAMLGTMRRTHAKAGKQMSDGEIHKAATTLSLAYLMNIILPATLEAVTRGRCGDDPDAADYLQCSARSTAFFAAGFFPILRDLASPVYAELVDDENYRSFGYGITPIADTVELGVRVMGEFKDAANGEDVNVKNMVRGFGAIFGLPGTQSYRSLEGLGMLVEGETADPTVLLTGNRD